MKWRPALGIAPLLSERLIVKAAEWNPELSSRYKTFTEQMADQEEDAKTISTNSSSKRLKPKNSTGSDHKNNKSWIKADGLHWKTITIASAY